MLTVPPSATAYAWAIVIKIATCGDLDRDHCDPPRWCKDLAISFPLV